MSDSTVEIKLEPHVMTFIIDAVSQELGMDLQDLERAQGHNAGAQTITEAALAAEFSGQIYDLLKVATEVILVVPEDAA